MRFGRLPVVVSLALCLAAPVQAGSKQSCKDYLQEFYVDLEILPQVTGLDGFVKDPEDKALRLTTSNMLGSQDTDSLQKLTERIESAYAAREDCTGDVGKKAKMGQTWVKPDEFVAYVEKLHDHGLPLIATVLDERLAEARADAERSRIEDELTRISGEWSDAIDGMAAARADGSTDTAAVERLRSTAAGAETVAGRCLARTYLLRVAPPSDDFADQVRAFAECLDIDDEVTPPSFVTFFRDDGFRGAVASRNLALASGNTDRAIREWNTLIDVFGRELGGAWSEPAYEGLPEDVETLAVDAADRDWPRRSRIELGLYCLTRGNAACMDAQLLAEDGTLDVSEGLLAGIAEDLGEAGDPLAVDLWDFLVEHGAQSRTYRMNRIRFLVASGKEAEVRKDVADMIAAGDCASAARTLSMLSSSAGSDPMADARALMPCTRSDDESTVRAAWGAIGDAYRTVLGGHMLAEPRRMNDAVALAKTTLDIPDEYLDPSVADYARYVLQVSRQESSSTVDSATAKKLRYDGCTQTLSSIQWKRRKEDESYILDLRELRVHCCSFLQDNRSEWVTWMESGPTTTDHRGKTFRREFSPQEIVNKQSDLDRYCSDR